MKGVKLCYGLLSVFFIIFGLSLSVSSDANALKYSFDAFNFADRLFYNPDCTESSCSWREQRNGFDFTFYSVDSNFSIDSDLTSLDNNYVTISCSENATKFNLINTFRYSDTNDYQIYGSSLLNQVMAGQDLVSSANMYVPSCDYSYDSIYSQKTNLVNGEVEQLVNVPNLLFDSDQPGYSSGRLQTLKIPLTLSDNFVYIPSGSVLEFDFGLVQKSSNNFPFISSSFTHELQYSYFTAPSSSNSFISSYQSGSVSCSVDDNYRFTTRSNELWEDYMGLNFHCSFTAPSDIYYFNPIILLSSSSYFLEYDYHGLYFSGSFLTTDHDDTWSGLTANPTPTGSQLSNSPGFLQLYPQTNDIICYPGDFICQLSNLFQFGLINPFTPLFSMFQTNSTCYHIPTIAGFLGAESDEVCPWFDSNVRSILTPVFVLLSHMLLFGFVVHWLGARSGNFIEDSTDHQAGSFKIKKGGK